MADVLEEWVSSVLGRNIKRLETALANGYVIAELLGKLNVLKFRDEETNKPFYVDSNEATSENFRLLMGYLCDFIPGEKRKITELVNGVKAKDRPSALILTERLRSRVVNKHLVPRHAKAEKVLLLSKFGPTSPFILGPLAKHKDPRDPQRHHLFYNKPFFDAGEKHGREAADMMAADKALILNQRSTRRADALYKAGEIKRQTNDLIGRVAEVWLKEEKRMLLAERGYVFDMHVKSTRRKNMIGKIRTKETKDLLEGASYVQGKTSQRQDDEINSDEDPAPLPGKPVSDKEDFRTYMNRLETMIVPDNRVTEYIEEIKLKHRERKSSLLLARNDKVKKSYTEVLCMKEEDSLAKQTRKLPPQKEDLSKQALKEEEKRILAEAQQRRQELIDAERQAFIDGIDFKKSAIERYEELERIRKRIRNQEKQEREDRRLKHTPICERIISDLVNLALKVKAEGGKVDPKTWHDMQRQFAENK